MKNYTNEDDSWVQLLSELPSLRDLEVNLKEWVPEGFDALTQCTSLSMELNIFSTDNLSCLQRLTRLRECSAPEWPPVEFLAALPDCLTTLHMYVAGLESPPDMAIPPDQLGHAIRHLTALEDLAVLLGKEAEGELDLSSLRRLTRLHIDFGFYLDDESMPPSTSEISLLRRPFCSVELGPQPCLRILSLENYTKMDDDFLKRLCVLPSLRELRVSDYRYPRQVSPLASVGKVGRGSGSTSGKVKGSGPPSRGQGLREGWTFSLALQRASPLRGALEAPGL